MSNQTYDVRLNDDRCNIWLDYEVLAESGSEAIRAAKLCACADSGLASSEVWKFSVVSVHCSGGVGSCLGE